MFYNSRRFAIILVTTIFSLCFGSCKKDFNLPPNDELSWSEVNKSTSNLDGIVNGMYGRWMNRLPAPSGNASAFDHVLYSEAMAAGRLTFPSPNLAANSATSQLYNFSMLADAQLLTQLTRNLYSAVAMANNVEYFIENDPPKDAEFARQKDRLLGEAYFFRALCFFYGVRYWGHQFGHNSTAANSGIMLPLNPSPDGTVGVGRSTVAETYNQIITDLETAITLLPANFDPVIHASFPSYRFRATKATAIALLAKVYFQQGTQNAYNEALNAINRVIGTTPGVISSTTETGGRTFALQSDVKIPFNNVGFAVPATNSEEILRLVNNTTAQQGYVNASLNLTNESGGNPTNRGAARWFLARPAPNPSAGTPVSTSPLFDDVVNDRRFTELTINNAFTGGIGNQRISNKWGFMTGTSIGMQSFPLIRAAELVITRAEINAILGNFDDALADYNLVRRRAITGYVNRTINDPVIGGTQAGLVAEICRERQRELLFEGDDFWSWKRMSAYNQQGQSIYPSSQVAPIMRSGGQNFLWNTNRTLLKFSIDDLTATPLLGLEVQNPD